MSILLEIRESQISGLGLFAKTFIPKNTMLINAFTIVKNKQWEEVNEPANFVNHSDRNNMSQKRIGNTIYSYSNRDIMPDDELTSNYKDLYKLNCPHNLFIFMKNPELFQRAYDMNRRIKRQTGTVYEIIKK